MLRKALSCREYVSNSAVSSDESRPLGWKFFGGGTFRDPSVASAVAAAAGAVAIFELVLRDEILQLRVDGTIEVPLESELVIQMKSNVRIVALGLDV